MVEEVPVNYVGVVGAVAVDEVPADYVGVVVTVPVGMVAAVIEYNVVVAVVAVAGSNSIGITDYTLGHFAHIHIGHCLALDVVIQLMSHCLVFETEMKCSASAYFA